MWSENEFIESLKKSNNLNNLAERLNEERITNVPFYCDFKYRGPQFIGEIDDCLSKLLNRIPATHVNKRKQAIERLISIEGRMNGWDGYVGAVFEILTLGPIAHWIEEYEPLLPEGKRSEALIKINDFQLYFEATACLEKWLPHNGGAVSTNDFLKRLSQKIKEKDRQLQSRRIPFLLAVSKPPGPSLWDFHGCENEFEEIVSQYSHFMGVIVASDHSLELNRLFINERCEVSSVVWNILKEIYCATQSNIESMESKIARTVYGSG